jgi:hypothetical protein
MDFLHNLYYTMLPHLRSLNTPCMFHIRSTSVSPPFQVRFKYSLTSIRFRLMSILFIPGAGYRRVLQNKKHGITGNSTLLYIPFHRPKHVIYLHTCNYHKGEYGINLSLFNKDKVVINLEG